MIDILMPRLSDTMEEGAIAVWHKHPGDEVAIGDVLVEIESDKATMEYEAYEAGVLHDIVVSEGQQAVIGTVIAHLDDGMSSTEATRDVDSAGEAVDATAADVVPTPDGNEDSSTHSGTAEGPDSSEARAATSSSEERVVATPLVRRIAREKGIDLNGIRGSGPGGRIVRADLDDVLRDPSATSAPRGSALVDDAPAPVPVETTSVETTSTGVPSPAAATSVDNRSSTVVPFDKTREVISRRLAESSSGTPHFTVTAVVDVDRLLALRRELNAQLEPAGLTKVSVNDLLVRASAIALRQHPAVNASYSAEGRGATLLHQRIHVGIAVASEGGLVVPVIRDVIEKTASQVALESKELVKRAQSRKLGADDLADGTFTISNLGMFGVEHFTAIINPPQGAILAVGAARPEPVAVEGAVEIRSMMRCTLSADHRIIDGALAARFLATLTELLEHPLRIIA